MVILNILEGVFSNFLYDTIKKEKTEKVVKTIVQTDIQVQPVIVNNEANWSTSDYVRTTSERLQYLISLINKKRHESEKLLVSEITEKIKRTDVTEVEAIFAGKGRPNIDFLDEFANCYNVNSNWLKHGKERPFSHLCHTFHDATDSISYVQEYQPATLYFVKENSEIAPCCMILQKSLYDYRILHYWSNWRISDKTGGTGQRQTTSIYKFICKLKGNYDGWQGSKPAIYGLEISENDFNQLIYGELFPETIIPKSGTSYWWDHFTDLHYKTHTQEQYLNWYGQAFINAQQVVRYIINI